MRERGREREREREKKHGCKRDIDWLCPVWAPIGDQTHNLLVDRTMNQPTKSPDQGSKIAFYAGRSETREKERDAIDIQT